MRHTILVVEDNVKNRTMLHDILTFHGYRVLAAGNGEEAVEVACTCQPDLVLMDIQMPVMDGITVTRILKEDPRTCRMPVIALTSFAMKGDREKLLQAGFDDYMSKPIDTRELPRLVRRHLDGRTDAPSGVEWRGEGHDDHTGG